MLFGNGINTGRNPGRWSGTWSELKRSFQQNGQLRTSVQSLGALASIPSASSHPYSVMPPQTAGAMASRNNIQGSGYNPYLNLAGGLNAEATCPGVGGISNANLALIVSAVSHILASGGFSTPPGIAGKLLAIARIVASGDISEAAMGALAGLAVDVSCHSEILEADLRASGTIVAHITPFSELSPQGLAEAVWSKLAESGLSMEEILAAVELKTAELHKIQGLDSSAPMTVTPTSRASGSVHLNITGDGITSTTVTRT
jgi:hypothetical protein